MEMRLALGASSVAHKELFMAHPFFAFAESYVLYDSLLHLEAFCG